MSALFVAGAGTDVGKTYVCERLIRLAMRRRRAVRALKPVSSGVPSVDEPGFASSDVARLLRAAGLVPDAASADAWAPWRFFAPLSPDLAARREGRTLSFAPVLEWTRAAIAAEPDSGFTLVEGVGGVLSPIAEDATNLDLAAALGCPVLLVVGTYLGAIGHALAAWECTRSRNMKVVGLVVSESAGSHVGLLETAERIARFAPAAPVAALQRDAEDATPTFWSLIPL